MELHDLLVRSLTRLTTLSQYSTKKYRARRQVRTRKIRTLNGNAQERGDGSDGERQAEEAEDKAQLAMRQEARHGRDPLRVGVDKVEFASRQGGHARRVVRVEAVLLEAPRANRGARQRRVNVVPRAVDRDALQ